MATKETQYEDISPPPSDLDSEPDDAALHNNTTTQRRDFDHEILKEEEEQENLLLKYRDAAQRKGDDGGWIGKTFKGKSKDHKKKRRRGKGEKGDVGEEGELMYEMEEGGGHQSEISSQASGSSVELNKMELAAAVRAAGRRPSKRKRRWSICAIVVISIIILFIAFSYGAYRTSESYWSALPSEATLLSNGTSLFAPTTLLISLDGFRADFLTRNLTPTLQNFINTGVSPKYMMPSFPSLTFPNHFTIATGLYPESHGIVGNTFWSPKLQADFHYTDPKRSLQPKWWEEGEPIWVTAEREGVKTGIHMWPGSEAGMDYSASYLDKFNGSEVLSRKTQRIFDWLDLPSITSKEKQTRPQLIAAYVPNVDSAGHKYGPNSTEIESTIKDVDDMLHDIFSGLEARNLTKIVNVIVVSDHGMATTSTDRLIQLDDIIDLSLIEHIDGWPLYGLRPKSSDPAILQSLYTTLKAEAGKSTHFDVYLRDTDMPPRYHFTQNERIAPLWVVPKVGWAIVHKEDFDVKEAKAKGKTYHPKGLHGYDFEDPLMRAIFVARGPSFPHPGGSRIAPFQNLEVYNILCDALGLQGRENNGTLRLPLRVQGVHGDGGVGDGDGDEGASPVQDTEDEPAAASPSTSDGGGEGAEATNVKVDLRPTSDPESEAAGGGDDEEGEVKIPEGAGWEGSKEEEVRRKKTWWQYMKAKAKAAVGWVKHKFKSDKAKNPNDDHDEH